MLTFLTINTCGPCNKALTAVRLLLLYFIYLSMPHRVLLYGCESFIISANGMKGKSSNYIYIDPRWLANRLFKLTPKVLFSTITVFAVYRSLSIWLILRLNFKWKVTLLLGRGVSVVVNVIASFSDDHSLNHATVVSAKMLPEKNENKQKEAANGSF